MLYELMEKVLPGPLGKIAEALGKWVEERHTLRAALQADLVHARLVAALQLEYLNGPKGGPTPTEAELKANPMNWMPIRTPVWDAIVKKGNLGVLGKEAKYFVWFFEYVAWTNEVLLQRDAWHHDFAGFVARYKTMLEQLKKQTFVALADEEELRQVMGIHMPIRE